MSIVSVIIPTYNHERFIGMTLESVFAQTFTDYEVIVVNDGSPDDTAAVLRPYIQSGRVQYIEQANAGQAAARNRGLAEAKGEFIAFLDDDDIWPLDKLEWQVRALSGQPDNVVASVGSCEFIGDRSAPPPYVPLDRCLSFEALMWQNAIISPGQVLVRRQAMLSLGGFDSIRGGADDWDCWLRLVKQGQFHVQQRTALLYRIHSNGASKNSIAMLDSSREVIVRHTDRCSRPTRGQIMGHLLEITAMPIAHQSVRAFGKGQIRQGCDGVVSLLRCLRASYWDFASTRCVGMAIGHAVGAAAASRLSRFLKRAFEMRPFGNGATGMRDR